MNKKILMSAMSILSALTIAGGATYAQFIASAEQTGNTFATGTVDLQISEDPGGADGTFGSSVSGDTFSGILPGETQTYSFWLKNNTTEAVALNVSAKVHGLVDATDGNQELDNALLLSWSCDTNGNNSLGDETTESGGSVRALNDSSTNTDLVLSIPSGAKRFCQMYGELPAATTNDAAGESISFDVRYDGTQVIPAE